MKKVQTSAALRAKDDVSIAKGLNFIIAEDRNWSNHVGKHILKRVFHPMFEYYFHVKRKLELFLLSRKIISFLILKHERSVIT